jgi:CheY-like chemotaxis protein
MGNRLLLADDSITIQKVVAIIFANEEFELTVVDNGIAALQKAREVRPDVMLVDALMPGKTGYEVCEEIRRDPELSSTPILLLIGAFEPFDEEKAHNCGADASITKPFESQQLIDRVKELLELGKTRSVAPAPAARALPIESAAEELWGDLSSFDTMAPPVAAPAPTIPAAPAQAQPSAEDFFSTPAPAAAPVYAPAPAAPAAEAPAPVASAPAAPAPVAPAPVAPATPAPPISAPAAPVSAAPAPSPAPAAPASAPPVFVPAQPAPAAAQAPVAAAPEIEEASYEDDLWGAFDLDEAPAVAEAEAFGVTNTEPQFEAEEFFSFEDESDIIEETGPALDFGAVAEPVQQQSAEELFSFGDETLLGPETASQPDPFEFPVEEPFSFEPEAAAQTIPFIAEIAEPIAPIIPVVPVVPVAPVVAQQAPSAPVFQPQASEVAPHAVQPAPFALSEADLVAALSKVSRELIERIIWEVVPDLAEVLIKEEIKKLKAGIKD